jgi:hypothetical protein
MNIGLMGLIVCWLKVELIRVLGSKLYTNIISSVPLFVLESMTKNLFVIFKIADNVGTVNKPPSRDTNNS